MSDAKRELWPSLWPEFTDEQRARKAAEDAKWPEGMWDGISGLDLDDRDRLA